MDDPTRDRIFSLVCRIVGATLRIYSASRSDPIGINPINLIAVWSSAAATSSVLAGLLGHGRVLPLQDFVASAIGSVIAATHIVVTIASRCAAWPSSSSHFTV